MGTLANPGLWLGLLIGIPAGMAFQHVRQVARTYRTTEASLPGQKKTVDKAESHGALWLLLVVGAVVFVLVVVANTY